MLQRVVSFLLALLMLFAASFGLPSALAMFVGENRRSVVGVVHGIDLNRFFHWIFLPCILILR
jgi:hypothetical protein